MKNDRSSGEGWFPLLAFLGISFLLGHLIWSPFYLLSLAALFLLYCAGVERLHDCNRSGVLFLPVPLALAALFTASVPGYIIAGIGLLYALIIRSGKPVNDKTYDPGYTYGGKKRVLPYNRYGLDRTEETVWNGHFALMCAIKYNEPEKFKALLELGVDPNFVFKSDDKGLEELTGGGLYGVGTPFCKILNSDNLALADILLEHLTDKKMLSIGLAWSESPQMVQKLLKKGADVNYVIRDIDRDCTEKIPVLYKFCFVHKCDKARQISALAELLHAGANPNAREHRTWKDGRKSSETALFIALHWQRNPFAINLLLEAGANPNLRCDLGDQDPYVGICFYKRNDVEAAVIAQALINHGFNRNLKSIADECQENGCRLAETIFRNAYEKAHTIGKE